MDHYKTIGKEGKAEYKILGSDFLSFAFPIANKKSFKEKLGLIKQLHPKANHHCFAYRLGLDENDFRSSDDKEPNGTAGRPILGQIDANRLTNTLIVVVRYFGGTLLGIPRLTNAYKTAASLVIQCTPIIQRPVLKFVSIECNYPELDMVLRILRQNDAEVQHQELQIFCNIRAGLPVLLADDIVRSLMEIRGVVVSEV